MNRKCHLTYLGYKTNTRVLSAITATYESTNYIEPVNYSMENKNCVPAAITAIYLPVY